MASLLTVSSISRADESAPVLSGTPTPTILVDDLYAFAPEVSASKLSTIRYRAWNKPRWLTLATYDGLPYLYGTPSSEDTGKYDEVYLIGYNDHGYSVVGPFSIEVFPADERVALLSWQAPTSNDDGSDLTDLSGYKVYHYEPGAISIGVTHLMDPETTRYVTGNLKTGNHLFWMTAVNAEGTESSFTAIVSKAISN